MNLRKLLARNRISPEGQTKRLVKLSDDVSNILKKIVIGLLIAVAVSQFALQSDAVRGWVMGVDRLEGTSFQ